MQISHTETEKSQDFDLNQMNPPKKNKKGKKSGKK
jgi:hypothetical protein